MVTFLHVRSNCPWCLLDTCDNVGALPDVDSVTMSMSEEYLEIRHHGNLDQVLEHIGVRLHAWEVGGNGEIVMVAATAEQQATCGHHPERR